MSRRFENRVAIVTGGNSGIGLAVARRLAAEGARVAIATRDADKADAAARDIAREYGSDAIGLACDVAHEDRVAATVAATLARLGRIDIIVNNAGHMVFKPIVEHSADDWRLVLGVDLLGTAFFLTHGLPRMEAGGAVVNVSSVHAVRTTANVASYAAAKAAQLALTRAAAIEMKSCGIRVNAVIPGAVDTPMLWENPNLKSGAEKLDPADIGTPDQIAAAIAFLASDEAAFITGAALEVDGGRLAHL